MAFHDRVLQGVVGWYGADVTPQDFLENLIEVIANIDGIDRPNHLPLAGLMMQSSDRLGAVGGGFYTG
ncbi:hypothetical protein ACSFE6_20680 [Pseudomonas baetica]|uniref:hypothetical protein n=1 Tax=Pseudomonas baetica TaxID=674054 RepID=UPI003EE8D603